MIAKIREQLKEEGMLQTGDGIVVGVSGGADSVCLLCLLAELREELKLELYALHVHHGIRGAEADRDADFTRDLCQRLGIVCEVVYGDIRALAREKKCSEEEMGRNFRYQALEECRQRRNCRWIAVAHHREDNAETVLWNLCRGSGLAGLTGIHTVRGHILRPLLPYSRAEIEDWLAVRRQGFCMDRTNLEEDYTRNRIRRQVLPVLEREVNSQAVRHIAETAKRLSRLQTYIEGQIAEVLERVRVETRQGKAGGRKFFWEKSDYEACPEGLRAEAVLELLKRAGGSAKDISAEHVRLVMELYHKNVGKSLDLPYGIEAERTYTGICFKQQKEADRAAAQEERTAVCYYLEPEGAGEQKGKVFVKELQKTLFFEIWDCSESGKRRIVSVEKGKIHFSDGKIIKFPESSCTKWFDYDRIYGRVAVRTRRAGDVLVLHPDGRRKKLKDYWIDRKLPKEERDRSWLLAAASEILWILGDRTGEGSRIGTDTKRILIVHLDTELSGSPVWAADRVLGESSDKKTTEAAETAE